MRVHKRFSAEGYRFCEADGLESSIEVRIAALMVVIAHSRSSAGKEQCPRWHLNATYSTPGVREMLAT